MVVDLIDHITNIIFVYSVGQEQDDRSSEWLTTTVHITYSCILPDLLLLVYYDWYVVKVAIEEEASCMYM
jgi:hypothetical protein